MGLVCITVPETCDVCYSMELATASSFNIPAGLTPNENLYLWVRDKFGKLYMNPVQVNEDGSFTVLASNYPDGFFNRYAGGFTLFLTTDDQGEHIVPMSFSALNYNCLQVTISDCQ